MLPILAAIGALSAGTGPIVATLNVPAARTVAFMMVPTGNVGVINTLSASQWQAPFGQRERVQYACDFTNLLQDSETIVAIEAITVSPQAVALGLSVNSTDRPPLIDTQGKMVGLWLEVASAYASDPAYTGAGITVGILVRVRTNATPPKVFERTAALPVRQL